MTVSIEIIQNGAINLLSEMEKLDLIRLNVPAAAGTEFEKKLSARFAGALRLSDIEYGLLQDAIQESRNEFFIGSTTNHTNTTNL